MRFDFVQFPSQVWPNLRASTPGDVDREVFGPLMSWLKAWNWCCFTSQHAAWVDFRRVLHMLHQWIFSFVIEEAGCNLEGMTWVASNPSRLLLSLLSVPVWTYNGRSIKPFRGGLLPPRLVRGMHRIWQCHPRCAECAEAIRWKRWHRVRMDLVWC